MQPYQEEYIANLRQIAALTQRKKPGRASFEAYRAQLHDCKIQAGQIAKRNMELLRGRLFPVLDELFQADAGTVQELEEFSSQLYNGQMELDVGLFCQIRQALLTLARRKKDRAAMIRHLYWLGMGRNSVCGKLVGLELEDIQRYVTRMRLCFTEAAAYLKYFDEIDDTETRAYIVRSRANIALGRFKSPSERIQLIKKALQVMQDRGYREKAPELPWEQYTYLTHQNMAASISYEKEVTMTAEDTAAIMESVYIIHHRHLHEAETAQRPIPSRWAFSYYAIEYFCGIHDLDYLLSGMEKLMDQARPGDFSQNGIYSMVSLPAFYCQFLRQYPERLPDRTEYVDCLYQSILNYVDAFPPSPEGNTALFLSLRQLAHTYVETGNGLPYGEFLIKLLLRSAPQVYVHSQAVGEAVRTLCGLILDEEPDFFDDIEFLRCIKDPQEKRRETLDYALGCGLFHDVGKINFIELYTRTTRQWFEEEYKLARLHTTAGATLLFSCPSTCRYAAAAAGHHAWYDGAHGYPDVYKRLQCTSRQMVDVIGLVNWLESSIHSSQIYTGVEMTFEQAVQAAAEQGGKRFSPLLTARLQDAHVTRQLEAAFARGREAAYRRMYEDAGGKYDQSPPSAEGPNP